MAKGAPDYSNVRGYGPLHRLDDLAELAARLGSIVTFDRRGNVLLLDGFEYGLSPWNPIESGSGTEIRISNEQYRSGGYSARLSTGTASAGIAQIYRRMAYPVLGKYGFEFSVLLWGTFEKLNWSIDQFDGTYLRSSQCKFVDADRTIQIRKANTKWETIVEDASLYYGTGLFHTIKMVVDLENYEYVRLIVDDNEYDISSYSSQAGSSGYAPHVRVVLGLYGTKDYVSYVHIDDVILTQNEP